MGQPIRPDSPGEWEGIAVPELNDVIEACIAMHNELPAHVEISWDVLLTDEGPVYLEGNIFPPGCDYKLTVFKDWDNFKFLEQRLLEHEPEPQESSTPTPNPIEAIGGLVGAVAGIAGGAVRRFLPGGDSEG